MSAVASTLQAVFEKIATTRMAGLPILNPAIHVEVVGFREWDGHWVGVLVTPWTINLVLMPGKDAMLEPLLQGENKVWRFPSGDYQFMGLNEPELGTCHICPLISPLDDIAIHEDAIEIALGIAKSLFTEVTDNATRDGELIDGIEAARLKGESLIKRDLSRRDFLRLPFLGR